MFKRVTLGIIVFLFVLGGALWGVFLNDETTDYVFVIPETLSVEEGDLFDLAIDSNIDATALNIISSNFSVVRLEGSQLVAQGAGSSYVTVETQDGRVQDQVLITVNPLVTEAPVEDASFEVVLGNERLTFNEPVPISQLDAPLRGGYTFMGFSLEENGTVLESDAVIDESLTLYYVYQAIEEETPEPPVVDDEDSEAVDESDEDSETPIDEDDEPITDSSPSSITVTLENDQGITMSVLTVSPGSIISVEDFNSELSDVGYFIQGETCENPYDFDTPLVTNTSIVFGETNYTSPCIELDEMATLGRLQVGETIQAFVSPSAATIDYEWFISANDRDYSLLSNVTGSTLELAPEHFRQYIAVKLTGTGDYTGSLSLALGRVGLSSQTIGSGDDSEYENDSETENIEQRTTDAINLIRESAFVPINSTSALIAIGEGANYTFTAIIGDEEFEIPIAGSDLLTQSYVLVEDIDLTGTGISFTEAVIGNDFSNPFAGVFDGNGYTISNLNIDGGEQSSVGLFGVVSGATIENLKLDSFNLTGGAVGSLSSLLIGNSTVANITVSGAGIKAQSNGDAGGLIGVVLSDATFEDISIIDSNIEGYNAGGLISSVPHGFDSTINISRVAISGTISGIVGSSNGAGGLIGLASDTDLTISTITQSAVITGENEGVGGIIGYTNANITMSAVLQNGTVSGKSNVGGVIGYNEGTTQISDVSQNGNVTGSGSQVGGIIGKDISDGVALSSVSQTGSVYGDDEIGGIIGYTKKNVTISGVTQSGTVTGSGNYVGGIIGDLGEGASNLSIHNVTHTGSVSGSAWVGGIIGRTKADITGSNISSHQSNITESVSATNIGTIIGEISGGTVNLTGINDGGTDETKYVGNDDAGHTFEYDTDDGGSINK